MTPQEKAKELCDKMYEQSAKIWAAKNRKATAKACALICSQEVIEFMIADDLKHECASWANSIEMSYWYKVKDEIEKL